MKLEQMTDADLAGLASAVRREQARRQQSEDTDWAQIIAANPAVLGEIDPQLAAYLRLVTRLHDELGMSVRRLAEKFNVSKSKMHRSLKVDLPLGRALLSRDGTADNGLAPSGAGNPVPGWDAEAAQ